LGAAVGHHGTGCPNKAREDSLKTAKSLPSNLARRSEGLSLYRATLRDGANHQGFAEQPCEAEQATKSPPSNLGRRSKPPRPCRATLRGRVDNQVPAEQPCDAEWTTKSLPSNLARRSERPSPCQATVPETSVREGRPNDTSPHRRDKTGHQTTFGPRVKRRKVSDRRQTIPRHVLSQANPHRRIGPGKPS
jgi:hypothetical protein